MLASCFIKNKLIFSNEGITITSPISIKESILPYPEIDRYEIKENKLKIYLKGQRIGKFSFLETPFEFTIKNIAKIKKILDSCI